MFALSDIVNIAITQSQSNIILLFGNKRSNDGYSLREVNEKITKNKYSTLYIHHLHLYPAEEKRGIHDSVLHNNITETREYQPKWLNVSETFKLHIISNYGAILYKTMYKKSKC